METILEEFEYKEALNVTRIVDYDGDSRYLVIATVGEDTPMAQLGDIRNSLKERLNYLFAPALVDVIVTDISTPIDLEFFRLKNEDAHK